MLLSRSLTWLEPAGALLLAALPAAARGQEPAGAAPAVDVPLSLYTDPQWPAGLDFGAATGVSFGDWDGDGWSDLFAFASAQLWRNLQGTGWILSANLNHLLPPGVRYGSSFGDYDNDGLADIGTEPREGGGDSCFHLLHNLGGGPNFADVAGDPAILDFQPCNADSETISWGDVDGDGDLDMFLPIYPPAVGSIDNKFLHNRGPTGPGGAYRFTEEAAQVGLLIPSGNARPEGTQFLDADFDGDLELYSNGALYQNQSAFDAPAFAAMDPDASGIRRRTIVDEGTFFLDYDLDGDYDLLMSYTGTQGLRLWEAYGDGSYFDPGPDLIEDYRNGATFGLSVADWDLDGDFDFQALQTFRKNLYADQGQRLFALASHAVDPIHLGGSAVAWADWDQDGDSDAAISSGPRGCWLYRNDSYDATTPAAARRVVRVRVVADSPLVARGLETEYGASVEIAVHGEEELGRRRKQLVSSSAGYLTQNEYALTFALPPDPAPGNPREDVRFDLAVDFPSLPVQGFARVDRHVNPALGSLNLAALGADREITVYRSGKVDLHGCLLDPAPARSAILITSAGGLSRPAPSQALPDPIPSSADGTFAGVEIDTRPAARPLLITEIEVDGHLGAPLSCGGRSGNLLLWDVTAATPVLAGYAARAMDPRNRRGHFPVDLLLEPGRVYRLVARVDSYRASPIAGPISHGSFLVNGGLRYAGTDPCDGQAAAAAVLDPGQLYLAVRVREASFDWLDLGVSTPGSLGAPLLSGSGDPRPGQVIQLSLNGAPPGAAAVLIAGTSLRCDSATGLALVPDPDLVLTGLTTGAAGDLQLPGLWPSSLERGRPLFFQIVVADPGAPLGAAVSNAVVQVTGE